MKTLLRFTAFTALLVNVLSQAGDITSGGDTYRTKPSVNPAYESHVEKHTEFYCMSRDPELAFEVSGPYRSLKNDGLLRIRRPSPRGGSETEFLEKATRTTKTNAQEILVTITSKSSTGDDVTLNLVMKQQGSKLVFVSSSYTYSTSYTTYRSDNRDNSFVCKWGPAKTMWD